MPPALSAIAVAENIHSREYFRFLTRRGLTVPWMRAIRAKVGFGNQSLRDLRGGVACGSWRLNGTEVDSTERYAAA